MVGKKLHSITRQVVNIWVYLPRGYHFVSAPLDVVIMSPAAWVTLAWNFTFPFRLTIHVFENMTVRANNSTLSNLAVDNRVSGLLKF